MATTENNEIDRLESKLTEACDALWDSFVDPREPFAGEEGGWWPGVGGAGHGAAGGAPTGPMSEAQLADLRNECRQLAMGNEFAINGHENRISYIVGAGHTYHVTARKGVEADKELALRCQEVIDEFLHDNRWQARQQEFVRRMDRDGEVFLRTFATRNGGLRIRCIEPDQVATPARQQGDPSATFGVLTDPNDVESVTGYYVDGQLIDADEVQHRKANVDGNVKRGLPLFTPVRKNLRRADKLLRNMSVVAEIQSAIALIRKHRSASRAGVEQFVASGGDAGDVPAGRSRSVSFYGPGTILDAPAGLEYDFPATGIDAGAYVAVLQAELRAIAARLVMPEFMLSSNASNSNYASTLVAEGPAMRMFQRLQASTIDDDCQILWRAIGAAVQAGRLPHDTRRQIEIQANAPSLNLRDPLEEARVNQIAFESGVLSRQTWSCRLGLDYDQEQRNLAIDPSKKPGQVSVGVAQK